METAIIEQNSVFGLADRLLHYEFLANYFWGQSQNGAYPGVIKDAILFDVGEEYSPIDEVFYYYENSVSKS